MSRLTLALAAVLAATALPAFAQTGATTTRAMPACSIGDTVVWENTKTKAYHLQGDTYFGNTKHGRYACKSAADAAGFHAAGTHASGSTTRPSAGTTSGSRTVAPVPGQTAAPLPDASETGMPKATKHHHRHKGMASPGPMPASPVPAATQ